MAGDDNSFTMLRIAVPAAEPSIPRLARVASAASVSCRDTPNTFDTDVACFMAPIISLTEVADNLAAVAKLSPMCPMSFTLMPNVCMIAVADKAAPARSTSPTVASFSTLGRAVIASPTSNPA